MCASKLFVIIERTATARLTARFTGRFFDFFFQITGYVTYGQRHSRLVTISIYLRQHTSQWPSSNIHTYEIEH